MTDFRKSFRAAAPAAAIMMTAALATSFSAGKAEAYQCMSHPTQSIAFAKSKFAAKNKARRGWSANVKSQLSLPWTVWSIAKDKTIRCTPYGGKQRCLVSARPCKYVVN